MLIALFKIVPSAKVPWFGGGCGLSVNVFDNVKIKDTLKKT
jgi:hypothetical protein